jgi:hypothetical protein
MRRIACTLLLAGAAAADDAWDFSFENGDRVRGRLAGVRDGIVLLEIPASPRAVPVPFGGITVAEPASAPGTGRAPAQVLRLRDGGALLGSSRAIREGRLEFEAETLGVVRIPGGEVAELLAAEDALRAFHRAAKESLAAVPLATPRFHALWARLGRQDGNLAWQAHRELVRAGSDAVDRLAPCLRAPPDAPDAIAAWIRALESDSAEARSIAHARLRSLGEAARPQLKAAARQPSSAEARKRIAILLANEPAPDPDPEVLRFVRAIRVLEEIGTPEAVALLESLANVGAPSAREARDAIERLRRAR